MFSNWFRQSTLDPLSVSMTGVKLADRVLVVGCSDPRLIAALGVKAGLTGRACAIDEDAARTAEAGRIALKEGALIETFTAPYQAMPFEPASFDVVVVRDALLPAAATALLPATVAALLNEILRLLRPGGRCMVIETSQRRASGGLAAVFGSREPSEASAESQALNAALTSVGFVAVRTLAEREGLLFVEGANRVRNGE
jgi:ubiquinone/menaquinone biosynthesis C-methylase UbiE